MSAIADGPRGARQQHRLAVVAVLRNRGSASRSELVASTGLSRTTISSLVAELRERGIVTEGRERSPSNSIGRPAELLALGPGAGYALGVAFGHSHLDVAVADLGGRVLAETRDELDVDHEADDALDRASARIDEVLARANVERAQLAGVGLGLPGPIDAGTGRVGDSVILPGWVGREPESDLAGRVRLPVSVDNDANLGALGEAAFGAAAGLENVVFVKVSSGIGAGLIIGGRLHRGSQGIAGELGHVKVAPDGPLCRCGSRGCLETLASAPVLLREGGDDVLVRAGRLIGAKLADLCNLLDPQAVIVGGDPAVVGEPLIAGVRDALTRDALPAVAEGVKVLPAALGARAEVLGALARVITDPDRTTPALLAEAA